MEILERRRLERQRVIEEAKGWASRLPAACTAVLIGSYARGDFNLWSDIDVILISRFKGGPLERLKLIDSPAGYAIIPITPEEFRRLLDRKDPIAVEAMELGVVLRDDLKLFG